MGLRITTIWKVEKTQAITCLGRQLVKMKFPIAASVNIILEDELLTLDCKIIVSNCQLVKPSNGMLRAQMVISKIAQRPRALVVIMIHRRLPTLMRVTFMAVLDRCRAFKPRCIIINKRKSRPAKTTTPAVIVAVNIKTRSTPWEWICN